MPATVTTATLELNAIDNVSATMQKVSRTVDDLGKTYERVMNIGLGLGGAFSVGAFADMIKSTIDMQAQLSRLGERSGTTASALSSMIDIAKRSNTDIDTVAGALGKLSRSMAEAGDGSSKAGLVFQALGIQVQDANGKLLPASQTMQELGQKLLGMRDQTLAVAFAQEILGKNGATLLPFLYELARAGELQAKVSDQDAAAAKGLEDSLQKLSAASDKLKISIANALVPALGTLADNLARASEHGSVLRQALIEIGKLDLAILAKVLPGQLGTLADRAAEEAFTADERARQSVTGVVGKPLVPAGTVDVMNPLGKPRPVGSSRSDPQQQYWDQYIANAKQADKELQGLEADDEKHRQELERQNGVLDQQAQHWKDIADPMAPYQRDLEQINALLEAGKLTQEQWADASKHVQDEMDNLGKKAKDSNDIAHQLGMTFSSAFEDAIVKGKSMRDVLQGIGEDIARLIVRQTITKPFAAALTNAISAYMSGGAGGGTASVGDYTAGGGFDNVDWASAASTAGASYDVGTPYVPQDGLAYLHKGEKVVPAGQGAGDVHINFAVTSLDPRTAASVLIANESVITGLVRRAWNQRGRATPMG